MKTARVVGLIAALVVFGNAKSWWDLVVLHTTAAGSTFGVGAGIALVLAILVVAPMVGAPFSGLGLADGSWRSSLRLGLWICGPAALAGGALIIVGSIVASGLGWKVTDVTPAASVPWGPLLWRALLLLWVDTVLPEELGFRGALMLGLNGQTAASVSVESLSYRRAWLEVSREAVRPAVLISSVAFAAWHVVVVFQDGVPDSTTIVGKLLVIAVGGLLFGGLRVVSRNLLAPVVGHWVLDMVAMLAARFAVVL